MAGIKRKLKEIDVSEIEMCSESVTVHGVVTELSPVKVSRHLSKVNYFKAKLTDEKITGAQHCSGTGKLESEKECNVNTHLSIVFFLRVLLVLLKSVHVIFK